MEPAVGNKKQCRICGNVFEPRSSRHAVCSETCRKAIDAANMRRKREDPEYRQKHMQERLASLARWRANNPERAREVKREGGRRHAHKRRHNQLVDLPLAVWEAALAHFGGCAYCGSQDTIEQDHFVPLARGGHLVRDNVVPACRKCNLDKSDQFPLDWLLQRAGGLVAYAKCVEYLGLPEWRSVQALPVRRISGARTDEKSLLRSMGLKKCNGCNQTLPLARFYYRPEKKSYYFKCQDCRNAEKRQYRLRDRLSLAALRASR